MIFQSWLEGQPNQQRILCDTPLPDVTGLEVTGDGWDELVDTPAPRQIPAEVDDVG